MLLLSIYFGLARISVTKFPIKGYEEWVRGSKILSSRFVRVHLFRMIDSKSGKWSLDNLDDISGT
jgi:hypothetical protein